MSVKTILSFLIVCFLLSISNMQSATIYVDASAPGPTYNGTSWGNAYQYLQDALTNANSGDEIWVAQGTYYPDEGSGQSDDDRTSTFNIPDGVAVYGGFDGTETLLSQRDFVNNITILSGDIGTIDDNSDNAYHVVKFTAASSTTILDGFTITNGYADGAGSVDSPNSCGGGIYNDGSGSGNSSNPTIQNCIIKDNYAEYQGGGVHNESNVDETPITAGEASPTFDNCTFQNNSTGLDGAGVNNEGEFGGVSSPSFTDCTFSSNSATDQGGAVYNDAEEGTSSPTFTGCTFTSNTASDGGGIYSDATTSGVASPTITDCSFSGHSAANGVAIYNYANGGVSSPTITDCTFDNNISTASDEKGGAILNEGYPGISSPTITNCIFTNNSADRGGAICNYGRGSGNESSPIITNCKFQGNSATGDNGYGGALFNYGRSGGYSSPIVTNCLFTGNVADYGAAVFNYDGEAQFINCTFSGNSVNSDGIFYSKYYTNDSDPEIYNSIIWNNNGSSISILDASTTVYYSNIANSGGSDNWDSNYGTDGGNNIDEDPLFENPIDPNDAPTTTGNFKLFYQSPCLDAGNDTYNSETLDIRGTGFGRKLLKTDYTQTGTIDMGAYEWNGNSDSYGIIFVNDNASGNNDGTSWANAYTTLQAALATVNSGFKIWVAAGTYKPTSTSDRSISFALKNNVEIYGGFAGTENPATFDIDTRNFTTNESILSGDIGTVSLNNDNSYNVFYHPDGTNLDATAILDGFTISNGYADGTGRTNGAGMYNFNSSPTINNVIFENNFASVAGGAVNNNGSSSEFNDCTFNNNTSANGGGAVTNESSGSPVFNTCTFSDNTVTNGSGGAVYNVSVTPDFNTCTFSDNTSSSTGGALFIWTDASLDLNSCTFSGNTSLNGGAIHLLNNGASIIKSSKFYENVANDENTGAGGAFFIASACNVEMTNCLLYSNTSEIFGGAIYLENNGTLEITNSTFTKNSSVNGGAIYANSNTTMDIYNSIIWANVASYWGNEIFDIDVNGSNITNSLYANGYYDIWETLNETNCLHVNPRFVNKNIDDYRISYISPCTDAGNDTYNNESYDIRGIGFARKLNKDDDTQVGTIDIGAYEYKSSVDPYGCEQEVWVDSDFTDQTPGWGVTNFDNIEDALDNTCTPGTVNISNYSYTGDVDMTGRTFIIGEEDFELTGNLTGGQIRVINTGALLIKDLSSSVTKTFPITDGTYNYTMTVTTDDNSSPDISVRISDLDPSGNINNDFWDISGPTNLNATVTLRVDKAAIAPKTLSNNTQIRYYDSTNSRYVPVNGSNFSIEEFDTYYIITITNVNKF